VLIVRGYFINRWWWWLVGIWRLVGTYVYLLILVVIPLVIGADKQAGPGRDYIALAGGCLLQTVRDEFLSVFVWQVGDNLMVIKLDKAWFYLSGPANSFTFY
jgi:hypothetical protein